MYDKSLRLGEQILTFFKRVLPENHVRIGRAMTNLVYAYLNLNKYEEALNLSKQLLTRYERILPPDHPKIDKTARWIDKIQFDLLLPMGEY